MFLARMPLEVEAQLRRNRPRRDVVRPAECGEEVVERSLVRQVDDRNAQTPLMVVAVEQIVLAHAGIKQASRCDALRIVVVVFLASPRYADQRRSKLRRQASTVLLQDRRRYRSCRRGPNALAGKSTLKLLIRGQGRSRHIADQGDLAWRNIGVCSPVYTVIL